MSATITYTSAFMFTVVSWQVSMICKSAIIVNFRNDFSMIIMIISNITIKIYTFNFFMRV
ncbi:hypothetical protein GLOIN_2v1595151, partial [Rhizophagus irregularis DAOM 181602=DAOM 197198]